MAVKASASITLSFMVDVKAVYRYYKLQASTATAPSVPTTNPPTGWDDAEPSYTSGSTNTLYFVDLTVFSNDTWIYSSVSKSSSYEAAKEAFNKAASALAAAEEAAKTATNYMDFVKDVGLIVGNMLAETLGKNVLIDADGVHIRNGETELASFEDDSIMFSKQVTFKADGIFLDNGDAYAYLGRNNILWSGGYYMHGSQSITFSSNISRQLSGVVFVWSYYNGTAAVDQDFTYFFVPKSHIVKSPGDGVRMSDPYIGMMKYLYISNGGASGHANNASSGTTNGIAWNNKNYVLRYVVGV